MNVYKVQITYNDPTEAEIILAAASIDEARENLMSYLLSAGMSEIQITDIQYLCDSASYFQNDSEGVLN